MSSGPSCGYATRKSASEIPSARLSMINDTRESCPANHRSAKTDNWINRNLLENLTAPFKRLPIASPSLTPADCIGSLVHRWQLGYQQTESSRVEIIPSCREMDVVGREQFLVQLALFDYEDQGKGDKARKVIETAKCVLEPRWRARHDAVMERAMANYMM